MIRAEAAADDKMGALDLALDKMAAQMRRAADRQARATAAGTPPCRSARPSPTLAEPDGADDDDGRHRAHRSARSP